MKKVSSISFPPVQEASSAYNLMASHTETTPSEARRTVEALECVLQNPVVLKHIRRESILWEERE